jgi:parallel beta-helix repeat protein
VTAVAWLGIASSAARAETDCAFVVRGERLRLVADCQTDQTLTIPDGMTLEGAGKSITAVDPPTGHFLGAIVRNAGAVANVRNLTVRASGLSNVCDGPTPTDNRLRGILFDGASGSIRNNRVLGVGQLNSGCQEGFGIDVRNASGDAPTTVDVTDNRVEQYQKAGIVVSGSVDVVVAGNRITGLGLTNSIAQNGIQLGFGARGEIIRNRVSGSAYGGAETQATGILVVQAGEGVEVAQNQVQQCDAGIALTASDGVLVSDNRITDAVRYGILVQADENALLSNRVQRSDGIGIYVAGEANTVEDNVARNSFELDVYNEGDNDYFSNRCDTSSGPPVDC